MIVFVGAGSWLVSKLTPLAREIDSVMLIGRDQPKIMDGSRAKSNEGGGNAVIFQESDYVDSTQLASKIAAFGNLTIVFAGVGTTPELLANTQSSTITEVVETHISFPIELVSALLPTMIRHNFGRFIFFGSTHGAHGMTGASLYSTAKAAQKGLSRSIAIEYGRFGITSNVVEIGYLESGYSNHLTENDKERLLTESANRKPVNPEDIMHLVSAVVQSESINGAVLAVDCGA